MFDAQTRAQLETLRSGVDKYVRVYVPLAADVDGLSRVSPGDVVHLSEVAERAAAREETGAGPVTFAYVHASNVLLDREFTTALAREAGFEIDGTRATGARNDSVSRAAIMVRDMEPLYEMFQDITHPVGADPETVAARRTSSAGRPGVAVSGAASVDVRDRGRDR